MTTTAEGTPTTTPRRSQSKGSQAPSSIWSKKIGRKSEEDVDHPPFVPTLPRVNLLPSSVPEFFTLRRVRRAFIAITVLLVIAFGAVWYLQNSQIADAQARLDQAQADNAAVAARVSALAPIKEMYDQITAEQGIVATALAAEPRASTVIARLVKAGGVAAGVAGVEFTSIAVEYRGIPESGAVLNPCQNPDPFSSDITIGCVTFSGTAANRDQISAMLTAMARDPLFIGPFVNNSTVTETTGSSGVMFTGTTGVSLDALITPLTDEQVAAILAPPATADAPVGDQQP